MIVYTTNKNWFRDIVHLGRSFTMIKIVRSVLLIGVYTTIISILHLEVFPMESEPYISSVFSLLGIVLTILLVFRTNTAYDRWWEGRKQWGALVNNCRNLAIYSAGNWSKENTWWRDTLAKHISNFCFAFVGHMRKGPNLEILIRLTDQERAEYEQKGHVPAHISKQIYQLLHDSYKEGLMTSEDMLNIRPMHQSLMDILGACERIKKTPIPFSYAVYLKAFITIYGLMLPFAMVGEIGYWSIPAVMIILFAFLGVEMMGEEIEDPFNLNCNDLPIGNIAKNISIDTHEILEVPLLEDKKRISTLYEKIF